MIDVLVAVLSLSHFLSIIIGVYFADMSSKSANYCYATPANPYGLLLLCEVALGKVNELLHADYEADQLPKGKHSVKGLDNE